MPERHRGKLVDKHGNVWNMTHQRQNTGSFGRRFVQLFPDAVETLAADNTGTPSMARVYLWSFGNLSFERWTMLNQRTVGDKLHLSQATIGRALADLAERGFLERRGGGPRQEWKLTPKGAWMGTASSYQKEVRARGEEPEKVVQLHTDRC